MVEPLPGKWVLYYDEDLLILKEEFVVNDKSKLSESQKKQIPKNRVYRCLCWEDFCRCKCGLCYPLSDQEPMEFIRNEF